MIAAPFTRGYRIRLRGPFHYIHGRFPYPIP